jgi:antirestriction protein ArdC
MGRASGAALRVRSTAERPSLYQEITDKIIAELEQGRVPWVQPWGRPGVEAGIGMPRNAATGRRYSGIYTLILNTLILWGAVGRGDRERV